MIRRVLPSYRIWVALAAVLSVALVGRVLLLASSAVSFHSDEAVVALMARHILQGARPTFFYGQAYMGSLDAWALAAGFRLLGESVMTIRIVQSMLYLGTVATGFIFAWKVSRRVFVAVVAALTLALPPVLIALYTTATLGGYNETMLLGNLTLIFGWSAAQPAPDGGRRSPLVWAGLGVCAGIGWWANGLIVAYALPIAIFLLINWIRARGERLIIARGVIIAGVGFIVGSAPWWVFALESGGAPLQFLLGGSGGGTFAGTDTFNLPFGERLLGTFFLGLPTVFGLRFPWTSQYFVPVTGVIVIVIYAAVAIRLLRHSSLLPGARGLILGMIGGFLVVFVLSRFSIDPTGRYFLPLATPLGVVLGAGLATLWERRGAQRVLAAVALTTILGYFAYGQISAARENPPGLTTQFNLVTHIPNEEDAALIRFLLRRDITRGYTNYWIAFRLAFLSDERLIFSASLPYKPDLSYTPLDERYPPYRTMVEAAHDADERIAYISANVPEVETLLEGEFSRAGISYTRTRIGAFTVYHSLSVIARAPRPPFN